MKLTEKKAELLLACVIAVRASSFMFNKFLLAEMGVFNILGLRFLIAGVLLSIIFYQKLRVLKRAELRAGCIIGVLFYAVIAVEMTATKLTDTSTVSLLENCAVIIVPVFESVLTQRLPDRKTALGTLIAFAGVVCLSLHHHSFSAGMLLALLSAFLYAVAIIATARLSRWNCDPITIGLVQIMTLGVLAMASSFIFETPTLPHSAVNWFRVLWLACVCAGFGFTLQPLAQRNISSAARAGTFCAMSPATATFLGVVVLHEKLGLAGFVGLALILFSMLLPHIRFGKKTEAAP